MEIKEVGACQSVGRCPSIFASTNLVVCSKPEQLISTFFGSTQCNLTTLFG